jgi:hypothetical protein
VNPIAEELILVSSKARKLVRSSQHAENRGPSGGDPIRKRFLGSEDRESRIRIRSPSETWTLIILVPDRVSQDMYFRYGVIYVRKWKRSVSAPFVPIPLGDSRPSWILYELARAAILRWRLSPSRYPLRHQFCRQRSAVVDGRLLRLLREVRINSELLTP